MTVQVAHDEIAVTGEGPLWDDRRSVLWWLDIQGCRLLGLHATKGPLSPIHLPAEIGLVALSEGDTLIVGLERGLYRLDPETASLALLSAIPAKHPNLRLNDGKADRQGRLWFGTMDKSGAGTPVGALYCRHPGGRIETVRTGVCIPNAITISGDGRTLYFTDSPSQRVVAFDLDQATGQLTNERIFYALDGDEKPDGAIIDANGDMWLAVVHAGRVDRIAPDGQLRGSFSVPVSKPTMATFGGPLLTDLYITSQRRFLDDRQLAEQPLAGSLLCLPGVGQGQPAFRVRI